MQVNTVMKLLIMAVCVALGMKFKCSDDPSRYLRAISVCKNSSLSYVCLNNTNINDVYEDCVKPDQVTFAPLGQKLVYTRGRRNVNCTDGRFQPFKLYENVSSDCVFVTSLCAEEGQMIYQNATTFKDSSCRCDHNKGYSFVARPRHSTFCIPPEEDCTCFIKTCLVDEKLSYNYTCVPDNIHNFTNHQAVNTALGNVNRKHAIAVASICLGLILTVGLIVFIWDPSCLYEQSATEISSIIINSERQEFGTYGSYVVLRFPLSSAVIKLNRIEWCIMNGETENKIEVNSSVKYSGGTTENPCLTISHVVCSDSGKYLCRSVDSYGTERCYYTCLEIKDHAKQVEPSSIPHDISLSIVPSEQNLEASCTSDSKTFPECNDNNEIQSLENTQKCCLEPLTRTVKCGSECNSLDSSLQDVQTSMEKSIRNVVAIDIGTTFTRYAFLTIDAFCNGNYKEIIKNIMPTRVLFKKTGEFSSFGNRADDDYSDALYWGFTDMYQLFENFKIEFYRQQNICANTMISNEQEASVLATDLFGAVVKSVKDEVVEKIRGADMVMEIEEIFWVLTVPDAWSKSALELFRMCCVESGIPDANLLLEAESTAASMYFNKMQPDSPYRWFHGANCTKNMNYLLIDLGGGTCDITVYNRMNGTDTKLTCRPSYSVCGNKIVVKEFFDTIETIIGDRALIAMETEERSIYLRWKDDLEELISSPDDTVKVPVQTMDKFCQQFKGKKFHEAVECFGLYLDGDKLHISKELKSSLFNRVMQSITSEIKSILEREKKLDIHTFLIMGGFAASTIVKDDIKKAFSDKNVIYSDDSSYSLTMGSLLCGFQKLGHDL